MSKFLKYSLVGGGVAVGLLLLARFIKNRKSKGGFPLKKGSKGPKVEALQRFLNKEDNANLQVNGKFDAATLAAWKRQQYPFEGFLQSWPNAVEGQVNEDYYNAFVKQYEGATEGSANESNANGTFPLKRGSQGEEVKLVQRLLNENFNSGLPVNGNFDSATEAALIAAQNSFRVKTALRVYGTPSGYAIGEVSQGLYEILKNNS